MTRPVNLPRLIRLDIPVELQEASDSRERGYHYGLDMHGILYLTYQHDWPSRRANRPRLSVYDPKWSPMHGLRYVEWVT